MNQKFKIVVPSYDSVEWIDECLQSIENQKHTNYDVIVIDDASPRDKQREVIETFTKRNGWKHRFNSERVGAMQNIAEGIALLDCQPDDVIFVLDGDDWFYNENSLSVLNAIYEAEDVDLTYGQYLHYPTLRRGYCTAVPDEVRINRSYRRAKWRFYQPRSFKAFLWQNIKDQDLRDEKGRYVQAAYDVAMMFPMLEMVGDRFKFLDEYLYVYNCTNPLNDYKIHRKMLIETERYLRQKPKYEILQR